MKPLAWFGLALVAIGLLLLVYQSAIYWTRPGVSSAVQAEVNKEEAIPPLPIIGVVSLGVGIFVAVFGTRRDSHP